MFAVILQDAENNEVSRVFSKGNEKYLPQIDEASYPYLSELSDSSYDVFSQADMGELIEELRKLNRTLADDLTKQHIDEIITLAIQCLNKKDYKMCFTPF